MTTYRQAFSTMLALVLIACGHDDITKPSEPPPGPAGLAAEKFSDGEVVLTWEAGTKELRYIVRRSEGDYRGYLRVATTEATAFRDTGLIYETTYSYRVTAVDEHGQESEAAEISGTPRNNIVPAKPGAVSATATNMAGMGYAPQVILTWPKNPETDVQLYRIRRTHFGSATTDGFVMETPSPGIIDSMVTPGQVLSYAIWAVDRGGLEGGVQVVNVEVMREVALRSPDHGSVAGPNLAFSWAPTVPVLGHAEIVYVLALSATPGAGEIWSATSEEPAVRYDGSDLAAGTYWWWVVAHVRGQDGHTTSTTASHLRTFRVGP